MQVVLSTFHGGNFFPGKIENGLVDVAEFADPLAFTKVDA
jgi:hypothetical protein